MNPIVEQWKEIPRFRGRYSVSDTGKFRNNLTGLILRLSQDRYGYNKASLRMDGKPKNTYVHREMALLFIDNPSCWPEVNHIDGIKTHNHLSNLEWITSRGNNQHAISLGLIARGEKNANAKLTSVQIEEIRQLDANTPKVGKHRKKGFLKNLSNVYGVSKTQIERIINKKLWI